MMGTLRKQLFLDYSFLNEYYYSKNLEKPFQFTNFTKSEFEITNVLENFTLWQRIKTYIFIIRGVERGIRGRKFRIKSSKN